MIKVGDQLPLFKFTNRVAGEFVNVDLNKEVAGKKVVIFGLPGAFTPTCSAYQLPGFEKLFGKFKQLGVDSIFVHSVNDPFVMNSWLDKLDILNVRSLPDGNGDFATLIGTLCQKRNVNFGPRSWRYAMVVEDGVVTNFSPEDGYCDNIDDDPYEASKPEAILKWLKNQSEE
tara:strand:+ start:1244 stop:1759 length:516 start_codon:yes stop_codon:yes gene_type:complete